jgi:hypothetical protein
MKRLLTILATFFSLRFVTITKVHAAVTELMLGCGRITELDP